MAWYGKKTKPNTIKKPAFINQRKCTTTRNTHKNLKPRLVVFYDIRPGNGAGLFSKEKISKEKVKKTDKWERIQHKQTNNIGKVFPYLLPSVGPVADPGVQAVSPQVT